MFPGVKIDDKIHGVYKILKMPISQMPYFLYPRIYKVTDIYQEVSLPYVNESIVFILLSVR